MIISFKIGGAAAPPAPPPRTPMYIKVDMHTLNNAHAGLLKGWKLN